MFNKEEFSIIQEALKPYIGKPIGIRHHLSGVWLGVLLGPGIMPHMIRIEGRRVWSWSGGPLEFSELCRDGCSAGDRLGTRTVQEIPIGPNDNLVELTFQVSDRVIEKHWQL